MILSFFVMTMVFLSLYYYFRAVRRDRLAAEWEDGDFGSSKETFITDGLQSRDAQLRRSLIWAVYVVPSALIVITIYVTNFA